MSSLCKPVYIVNALPKLNPSILKQRRVISVNHSGFLWSSLFPFQTLPQRGIVLEILPGKFSEWDNVPFSVNGIQCFCHFWTLLQIQEGRCGTIGSCSLNGAYLHIRPCLGSGRSVYLVWKTWSPSLLRACFRETWKQLYSCHCLTTWARIDVECQSGSLSPGAVKTSQTSGFRSPWRQPMVLQSIVFYGWRLQWSLMGNSGTSSHCLSKNVCI